MTREKKILKKVIGVLLLCNAVFFFAFTQESVSPTNESFDAETDTLDLILDEVPDSEVDTTTQENQDKQELQNTLQKQKEVEPQDLDDVDDESIDESDEVPEESEDQDVVPRIIDKIFVEGNTRTPTGAILNYVTYKQGEVFDPARSRALLRSIFYGLPRFRNITLKAEPIGKDKVNLYVVVEEKTPLKEVLIEGNKKIQTKDIKEKINFDIPAIDEAELKTLAQKIKKLYIEKGFNQCVVHTELKIDVDNRATAYFTIEEGPKSVVKRISFDGNCFFTDKELRNKIYSKEDWVLSFLDQSGSYHPERLEADRYMIEQLYQNHGFLKAKVVDLHSEQDECGNYTLTFEIEEGDQYIIDEVQVPGNDILPEEFLRARIPIKPGQVYSRQRITNTIQLLERIWGNHGYIFAHIDPSVQPDDDEKTVSIAFYSDLGSKVRLNKLTIKGNQKTRDKVIRRRVAMQEGQMLIKDQMESAKQSVESLGYFEQQDGVNWKIRRLSDELADLDLVVHEAKTGHFEFQMGFGGAGVDLSSPATGFNVKANLADTNLFGSGINLNLEASWAKNEQTLVFHIAQPWLFDKPISGALDIYHRRPSFDTLRHINLSSVNQKLTGGAVTAGFISPLAWRIFPATQFLATAGVDSMRYDSQPIAQFNTLPRIPMGATEQYQSILDREFSPGDFAWVAWNIEQNRVNHPVFPSRGHKMVFSTRFGIPAFEHLTGDCKIGFYKVTLDANWFTPLIDEYNLILRLHGYAGFVAPFAGRNVPFFELFHIGGPNTVRGYLYGQIGPRFLGDCIGASKALYGNVELIFPITGDMSIRGVVFYDGGAGFDSPYADQANQQFITGNNFDYRHAVGFGLRLLKPMPMKIDWGFKIDPRRDRFNPENDESAYEVHFGMSYDW